MRSTELSPPLNNKRKAKDSSFLNNKKIRRGGSIKSLWLFFEHRLRSKWAYSLYTIDLLGSSSSGDYVTPSRSTEANWIDISPIQTFLRKENWADDMRCARLGHDVYFLGGVRYDDKEEEGRIFPREVHVFNLITHTMKKLDASLHYGKPCPYVFAANDKLFVLGMWNKFHPEFREFECYDRAIGKWRVLRDPPMNKDFRWLYVHAPKGQNRLIVIAQHKLDGEKMIRLVYNIQEDMWVSTDEIRKPRSSNSSDYIDPTAAEVQVGDDDAAGGAFYLLSPRGVPFKSKVGTSFEDCHSLPWDQYPKELSRIELIGNTTDFYEDKQYHRGIRTLRYAGDGHFCHVMTGTPKFYYDSKVDIGDRRRMAQAVAVVFCKEISDPKEISPEDRKVNRVLFDKDDYYRDDDFFHGDQYVLAKIIFSKEYVMKRGKNAQCVGCFVY